MDGPDTGSEIVHTGLRNSSVNKGRNEVMLKEHIYQMKGLAIHGLLRQKSDSSISACACFIYAFPDSLCLLYPSS